MIENQTAAVEHRTRAWVRSAAPTVGWWPWPGIYLIALGLLFAYALAFFAHEVIERQTTEHVRARLARAGVMNLAVIGDGQEVLIRGEYEPGRSEEGLIARAEATRCNTLFGKQICPTHVQVDLLAAVPTLPPTPKPIERPHDFEVAWSGSRLKLTGEVPDSGVRGGVVELARVRFPDAEIVEALEVTGDRAHPQYTPAFARALAVLTYLEDGTGEWRNRRLNVYGNVKADNEDLAEATFHSPDTAPPLGSLVLQSIEEVDKCDQEFEEVLSKSTIYFATGKAKITDRSKGVLSRLVRVASDCPGDLIVEGHADIVGSRDFNQRLSLRRARAVVIALSEMGVNPARLYPRGLGIDRPAADNSTEAGRAQNRRIEVRIMRTEL